MYFLQQSDILQRSGKELGVAQDSGSIFICQNPKLKQNSSPIYKH